MKVFLKTILLIVAIIAFGILAGLFMTDRYKTYQGQAAVLSTVLRTTQGGLK